MKWLMTRLASKNEEHGNDLAHWAHDVVARLNQRPVRADCIPCYKLPGHRLDSEHLNAATKDYTHLIRTAYLYKNREKDISKYETC